MPENLKKELEINVKHFLDTLENTDITITNFKEISSEVEGIKTSLNTALGGILETAKTLREKLNARLQAIQKVHGTDFSNIEPLGQELMLTLDYIDKIRLISEIQQLVIALYTTYTAKLENALSVSQGLQLSNEFLNRTENFMKMVLEKGVEETVKIFRDSMNKIVTEVQKDREMIEETIRKLEVEIHSRDKVIERLFDRLDEMEARYEGKKRKEVKVKVEVPEIKEIKREEKTEERKESEEIQEEKQEERKEKKEKTDDKDELIKVLEKIEV